jgi:hypothetical protein
VLHQQLVLQLMNLQANQSETMILWWWLPATSRASTPKIRPESLSIIITRWLLNLTTILVANTIKLHGSWRDIYKRNWRSETEANLLGVCVFGNWTYSGHANVAALPGGHCNRLCGITILLRNRADSTSERTLIKVKYPISRRRVRIVCLRNFEMSSVCCKAGVW